MSEPFSFSIDPVKVDKVETTHRRIVTAIPAPGTRGIMERIARHESSNAMDQPPVIWDRANGYQIFDPYGNAWIDFSSTIFVANCGHAHPHMVKTLQEQAEKLCHAYTYPTEIRAQYLEKLIAFTPANLTKASLFSTGAEASERAIKLARLYGLRDDRKRRTIIGFDGNFHGKTLGAQMAGGYHEQKHWIGYHDPAMRHLPFPYPWVLEAEGITGREMFTRDITKLGETTDLDDVIALILESYQGWGGIFYPTDYVQAVREWTAERDALLIFDEIQAGFGRCGTLFAYEQYGVEADLVTCGKGVSGSMPLSVVLGRGEIIDLDPAYTSSHGGHPLSCAAGLANIEIFETENLVSESARKGEIVRREINRWKQKTPERIGRVLGNGLLWGVFLTKENGEELDPLFCDHVVERCLRKGVFHIRTGRGTLKLGPPLTIPDDALIEGLQVTGEAI
ncbi:MAG TPA: aspartate aminotransferase family protein, partial [Rhodospirillaceae bacterium]|nr:aspartate aminotransferase family protein [Rhodospirillaceae bacterium]